MILWSILKGVLPRKVLNRVEGAERNLPVWSIRTAVREQGLLSIYDRLTGIIPDITHQYSSFAVDSDYLRTKVRAEHSFQINLVNEAMQLMDSRHQGSTTIVDIGDSAGTHLLYIKGLHPGHKIRCLSVNMDTEAVKRIREKGLEAICARAEDLASFSIEADIFLSFEMLEHLMNPFAFLHGLSEKKCLALVVTVPYVAHSRVGLRHIRCQQKRRVNSESTHIFELSPDDWRLVFQHSGWAIEAERIYLQYPEKSPFRLWLKRYWQQHDFEGFYGAILKPNKSWSELYDGW